MVKLDIKVDRELVVRAIRDTFGLTATTRDLSNWVAGIKTRLETGVWDNHQIGNGNRDEVLVNYLSYSLDTNYETCPTCPLPSVGPCLLHR